MAEATVRVDSYGSTETYNAREPLLMVTNSLIDERDPLLSIVIVNCDGTDDTLHCIESILSAPPSDTFEIILIDNSRLKSCLPLVDKHFPMVQSLSVPERQGFAKNYNLGISLSHGEYILILNNDTLIHDQTLNRLLAAIKSDPRYGMVGPKLLSRDGIVQTDCARNLPGPRDYLWRHLLFDPGLPPGRLWDRLTRRRIEQRPSGPVACISGACMLISRAAIEQVGALDEGFNFYYEDIEWCHRLQRHKKKVGYIAEAELTHIGDQSLSRVKVWAKKSEYQSALRYFESYWSLSQGQRQLLWLVTLFNYFMRGIAFLLAEAYLGKQGYARAYLFLGTWLLGKQPRQTAQHSKTLI